MGKQVLEDDNFSGTSWSLLGASGAPEGTIYLGSLRVDVASGCVTTGTSKGSALTVAERAALLALATAPNRPVDSKAVIDHELALCKAFGDRPITRPEDWSRVKHALQEILDHEFGKGQAVLHRAAGTWRLRTLLPSGFEPSGTPPNARPADTSDVRTDVASTIPPTEGTGGPVDLVGPRPPPTLNNDMSTSRFGIFAAASAFVTYLLAAMTPLVLEPLVPGRDSASLSGPLAQPRIAAICVFASALLLAALIALSFRLEVGARSLAAAGGWMTAWTCATLVVLPFESVPVNVTFGAVWVLLAYVGLTEQHAMQRRWQRSGGDDEARESIRRWVTQNRVFIFATAAVVAGGDAIMYRLIHESMESMVGGEAMPWAFRVYPAFSVSIQTLVFLGFVFVPYLLPLRDDFESG